MINAFHRCQNDWHTGSDKESTDYVYQLTSQHCNRVAGVELSRSLLKRAKNQCIVMADYKIKGPR